MVGKERSKRSCWTNTLDAEDCRKVDIEISQISEESDLKKKVFPKDIDFIAHSV